jgi:hypothetical protein
MAATLHLAVTPTSESVRRILIVLPGPENVWVAVGISLLSYVHAIRYRTLQLIANVLPVNGAMFNSPVNRISERSQTTLTVLMDADNVDWISVVCNCSISVIRPACASGITSRHFDFMWNTVGIQPGVTLSAAAWASQFSTNSEATLYSFP